jgi:hypothetical protein
MHVAHEQLERLHPRRNNLLRRSFTVKYHALVHEVTTCLAFFELPLKVTTSIVDYLEGGSTDHGDGQKMLSFTPQC